LFAIHLLLEITALTKEIKCLRIFLLSFEYEAYVQQSGSVVDAHLLIWFYLLLKDEGTFEVFEGLRIFAKAK
jgi:hypothetical protein